MQKTYLIKDCVFEPKFMCPVHMKLQSLEQRKVYCRAKQGERAAQAQKDLMNSPMAFREEFLKATFGLRAPGCVTFFD